MRLLQIAALGLGLAGAVPALSANAVEATLYKNPQCGCCEGHAKYLRSFGWQVTVIPTHDLNAIKADNGVPEALAGCHTMLVDGYVVEGHVPIATLNKLLTERPAIEGISLPGMPAGTPGMGGEKEGPLTIYEIGASTLKVYAVE